jgi:DNA-directed RNA polymerase specialized sigma24 family protein
VAQPAIATDHLDPTLVARARRYERDAVAELCDRNLDALFRMCEALAGDPVAAEALANQALSKALDGLPGFEGDGPAFDVWLMRLGAASAARHRPQTAGLRLAMARLSNFDYELIALRILAGVDSDHLAPLLNAQPASLRAWIVGALRELDGRSGAGWGHDLRALDAAVDDVLRGEEPFPAASRVSAPSDTVALLRTASEVHALAGEPIPPEAATRLRTNVLAATAERRALWVYRHHGVATVPGIQQRRYPSRRGAFLALGAAGILALVVGAVMAVFASFAGPDSAFYPLKRFGESTLVAVDLDPVDRAQLEVKLAQTRAREAEDMASRGDGDRAIMAVNDRYDLLRAASQDLIAVPARDTRWNAARTNLFNESDHLVTPIEHDLQVTGQATASAEVQRLASGYEAERKPLEADLGRQPAQPQPVPTAPAAAPLS